MDTMTDPSSPVTSKLSPPRPSAKRKVGVYLVAAGLVLAGFGQRLIQGGK
jgi:hypothetical protein